MPMNIIYEEEAEDMMCPIRNKGCLGPQCMMWRWTESRHWEQEVHPVTKSLINVPKGFCGLAGGQMWDE